MIWRKKIPVYPAHSILNILTTSTCCLTIVWIWLLYAAEIYAKKWDYSTASQYFPLPKYFYYIWEYELWKKYEWYASEEYFVSKVVYDNELLSSCHDLVSYYKTVENYFYCWEILERAWYNTIALHYYTSGLDKIPDLWNPNSVYYDNFIINNFVDGERFMSKRYSKLWEILAKLKTE